MLSLLESTSDSWGRVPRRSGGASQVTEGDQGRDSKFDI